MTVAKTKGEVSKAQGVRNALAALGNDAKPQAIQDWIKSNYGIDMDPMMISSYKSNELKRTGSSAKGGRASKGGGNLIEDISTVKGLLARHSKADLLKLIDALS